MPTETTIPLNAGTGGPLLRAEQLSVGGQTVDMEVMVIGDPTTSGNLLAIDSGGRITVNVNGTIPVSGTVGISGTVAVTQSTSPWVDNISQFGGSNVVTGTGTGGAGIPRVTVSSDSFPATEDVSDRAGRLIGVVYGSQGQQLKQTATNYNAQVELATGGTLYDARQIRALTVSDAITVTQASGDWKSNLDQVAGSSVATATTGVQLIGIEGRAGTSLETSAGVLDINVKNVNNSATANSNPLFVRVTDGTNNMPTGDAVARTIHVTADNATIAVTQSSGPWTSDLTKIAGSAIGVATTGVQLVGLADGLGNIIGSESIAGSNFLSVNIPATVSPGTTASDEIAIVGGVTNDLIPQYLTLPLSAGGYTVSVSDLGQNITFLQELVQELRALKAAVCIMANLDPTDFDPILFTD